MKKTLKILLSSIAFMVLAAGCSKVYDDYDATCPHEQPVSIIATIDNGNLRSFTPTRDTSDIVNENGEGLESDRPYLDFYDAETYEKDVKHVFLFVYKKDESIPYKVIFYYNSKFGDSPLTSDVVEKGEMSVKGGSLEMNLELYSGTYNFVLLVNSKAALEKANKGEKIDHPENLVEENTVLTSDDLLKKQGRQFLPMVGESELIVPTGRLGSETERVPLAPDIKLERVHARIQFLLSTQKSEEEEEYFSPILKTCSVLSLKLVNERRNYKVMPSADDYTVIGTAIRATSSITEDEARTISRDSFHQGANEANGNIGMYWARQFPFENNVSKYIYVAPNKIAEKVIDCLRLDLEVKFNNEKKLYRIPVGIFDDNRAIREECETRRNTTYLIHAILKGRDITVLNYEVIDWTNQNVDIPW